MNNDSETAMRLSGRVGFHPEDGLRLNLSVEITPEEMRLWEPDAIAAFFSALAKIVAITNTYAPLRERLRSAHAPRANAEAQQPAQTADESHNEKEADANTDGGEK